jgi:periplasmic divalent cation tolerance protein
MSIKLLAVFTSTASQEEAERMAVALVKRGLAACAQICRIESFYIWDGSMHHDPEFRIVFKTTAPQYEAVQTAIEEMHSYELPAIYAIAVEHSSGPYAAWVETGSSYER